MSEENKHIKDSLKKGFEGYKRKAPEGIWSKVSSGIVLGDDELKIKKGFDEVNRTAPENSWQSVKKQVIIDEVWDNISAKQKKRRFAVWFWSAGLILLLFGSSYLFITQNSIDIVGEENLDHSHEIVDEVLDSQNNIDGTILSENSTQNNLESEIEDEFNDNRISDEYINASELDNNDLVLVNNTDTSVSIVINQNTNIDSLSSYSSIYDRDFTEKMELAEIYSLTNNNFNFPKLEQIEKPEDEHYRKFEIGLTAGLNNTWIFNNDVKDGLRSTSLFSNNLSIGYNYGLNFNYNFNSKSSLAFQYDFRSIYNQGYDYYSKGRLFHRNIQLKLQKISLSYKYNLKWFNNQKSYFTFKGGGYFSHSIKEESSINWVENNNDSNFNTIDYGLKFAIGREHNFNRINIEYGIASDVGLLNITAESINNPKKFNYTSTYYSGVYLSIRYLF